jgi:uncharacterized membrane protein
VIPPHEAPRVVDLGRNGAPSPFVVTEHERFWTYTPIDCAASLSDAAATRYGDLVAASATALICAAVVLVVPITAARAPFAVALCLVLPGYALAALASARRTVVADRLLLLALPLSLSVLAIGTVVLGLAPGGLRSGSWTSVLAFVTIGGCAVAASRRSRVPVVWPRIRMPRTRHLEAALVLVGVVAVAGAFVLARTPVSARNASGYAQLWVLPAATTMQPGVHVGVQSGDLQPARYRLELRAGSRLLSTRQLRLAPGQRFEQFVPVGAHGGADRAAVRARPRVTALLYRNDRPTVVYRRAYAWLTK